MAGLGGLHAIDRHERIFHRALAVFAHHAFDFHDPHGGLGRLRPGYGQHLVFLGDDRFDQFLVRHLRRQTHNRLALFMAGLGGLHALNRLKRILHRALAVLAHHAFDFHDFRKHRLGVLRRGNRAGSAAGFVLRQHDRLRGAVLTDFAVMTGAVELEEVQAEGVADHAEAGQAHRRRAEHGIHLPAEQMNERAGGQRDADNVVDERPEQILMNVGQSRAAHADGGGDVGQAALHEHDVRGVDGDVRACADGDADIGPGERGRVVDAVADHGHSALLPELPDDLGLAVGQHAGHHFVHSGLRGDGAGGALIVAGQHDHAHAHVLKLLHGLRAVLLDDVGHGNHAQQAAVFGEEQRGPALSGQRFGLTHERVRHGNLRGDVFHAAAKEGFSVYAGGQAVSGEGGEILRFGGLHAVFLGMLQHGAGQRMLALLFKGRGEAHKLLRGHAVRGQDVGDSGLAGGDGAGLVERDNLRAAGLLERDGGFEEDAVFRAHAAADHDGDRGRKAERARAADDQNGDAAGQREADGLAGQQPYDGRNDGDGDDHGHEHAGHAVGHLRDGRLGRGGVADHADDLGQGGILADAGGLALDEARLIDRRGGNRVARFLVDRDALAGERGFVDCGMALEHHAVDRDVLARADDKHIALFDLLDRHGLLGSVYEDGRRFGRELHEGSEGVGGLALGARLEHFADGDEGQNHGGGFEVELMHEVHGMFEIACRLRAGHGKERIEAVDERRARAEGDQRIHIGRAVDHALDSGNEELLVDEHDDGGEDHLNEADGDRIVVEERRQRPAPHRMAHGHIHEHGEEAERGEEAASEDGGFPIGQRILGVFGFGLRGCALDGRAVSGSGDGGDDFLIGRRAFDAHGVGQQADRAGSNAFHLIHGLFDACGTGGAAHAGDVELFHTNLLSVIS